MIVACQIIEAIITCDCKKCRDNEHERYISNIKDVDMEHVLEHAKSVGWNIFKNSYGDEVCYAPGHRVQ